MEEFNKRKTFYSEPVQEIMGSIPSWTIRWGITVISAVFALIVIGSCIIKYPQSLPSTISIISANPPSRLEARYAGIIDTIAVINGQTVQKGDLIVLLKTPAVYEDIQAVKKYVDLDRGNSLLETAANPVFEKSLELGDLQDKWTEMCSLSKEYLLYCNLDQIGKKRILLSEQIKKNQEYLMTLHKQMALLEKDTRLQLFALQRDSILWSEGMTALAEYEVSQQAYLSKLSSLVSFEATIQSADFNMLMLEQGLNELDTQRRAEEDAFNRRFSKLTADLMAQIATWTEMYAIVAPFDGVVSLHDFWGTGQHVDVGDALASVVPDLVVAVEGRMKVSSVGFGQIKKGQKVIVRLNGFPYIEFGILKGVISRISQVPEKMPDGSIVYNVEVSFPNGLESTYHKTLPFIQDMDGEAEVIIREQRLIEHFIEPIISLFRNR